jgi:hypothetical protein
MNVRDELSDQESGHGSDQEEDRCEKAYQLYSDSKWQELVSYLTPIISELQAYNEVNSSNEYHVRHYANFHYLIANGYYHLGQYEQATQHAEKAANTRKMMPDNLRFDEDITEEEASVKFYRKCQQRYSALQSNSVFAASSSGSNSTSIASTSANQDAPKRLRSGNSYG